VLEGGFKRKTVSRGKRNPKKRVDSKKDERGKKRKKKKGPLNVRESGRRILQWGPPANFGKGGVGEKKHKGVFSGPADPRQTKEPRKPI